MLGTLIKAVAGIFVGAIVGYAVSKFGGATLSTPLLTNAGSFGNVTYGSAVTVGILAVAAFFTRNRGAIGQVLSVALAFQIVWIIMQAIQSTGML